MIDSKIVKQFPILKFMPGIVELEIENRNEMSEDKYWMTAYVQFTASFMSVSDCKLAMKFIDFDENLCSQGWSQSISSNGKASYPKMTWISDYTRTKIYYPS